MSDVLIAIQCRCHVSMQQVDKRELPCLRKLRKLARESLLKTKKAYSTANKAVKPVLHSHTGYLLVLLK